MNDLEFLATLAPETPLPSAADLAGPRARLMSALAAEAVAGHDDQRVFDHALADPNAHSIYWGRSTGRGHRGRWVAAGSAVIAAAAAVAVAVTLPAGAPHQSAPNGGGSVGPGAPTAHLMALQVLHSAAAAALREPAVVPRPDQFVYTKIAAVAGKPVIQTWTSVDGRHYGLGQLGDLPASNLPACVNGQLSLPPNASPAPGATPMVAGECTPQPGYFPDMPTTANRMAAFMERTLVPKGRPAGRAPNDIARTIGEWEMSDYFLPAQRAALYQYLATLPGVTVDRNARDVDGRSGIGVTWTFEGARMMNIFDPNTCTLLGVTLWGVGGQQGGQALLQTAIVDKPGQLP
jgi:hypothetical protein